MKRPEFKYIHYDPETICWGMGNNIVGLRLMARIRLKEPDQKEMIEIKEDYEKAEEVYNVPMFGLDSATRANAFSTGYDEEGQRTWRGRM